MNLPTALIAFVAIAIVAYLVTVVHAATVRMLDGRAEAAHPEARLLSWPKWLSALVVGLLVVWLLYRVRAILMPFAVGAVLAYVLNPAIDRLEQRRWPRTRAIALVFGLFLLIFVVAGLLVVPTLAAESRNLIANYHVYVSQAEELTNQVRSLAQKWGGRVGILPADVEQWFAGLGEKAQTYALSLLSAGLAWLRGSLGIVSLLVITPVVTFWLLRDYHVLAGRVLGSVPERQRTAIVNILRDLNRVAGSYLLGLLTLACLVSVYATAVLAIAGVRFSVLLGIATGVLSTIPYLGFPAALAIVALTMAVTGKGVAVILLAAAFLVVGNVVSDYAVAPRIIGQRVGLHPLCVIFAILAGGALFGFLGVLLAVPTAGAIKVVLMHYWPEVFAGTPEKTAA